MNKFIDSTFFIACFSAILYWAYSSYFVGFCNEMGINPDVVDKNIHQILFYGIHLLITPLFILFSLGIAVFSILYIFLKWLKSDSVRNYSKSNKHLSLLALRLYQFYDYTDDFLALRKLISFFVISSLILIVFANRSAQFQKIGSESANKFIKKIKESKYTINKISIFIDGYKKDLILIDCGSSKCVGYDYVDKRMRYFQISNDFSSDLKTSKFSE